MTDRSLADLLSSVDGSAGACDEGSFRVIMIPGYQNHYVGRNNAGHPALLLGSEMGAFHAPVRLALLDVRFGSLHRIHPLEGDEREQQLSVIICTSVDRQEQEYFLHVCATILRIVGPDPSLLSVVHSVQRLIELFRHLARPPSRSLNGLLGELFMISASRDVRAAIAAWRANDIDRFDFSTANVRVDVKASSDRLRVHHLSLEQCQPPAGTIGLLASVFIESSGGGLALRELIAMIERSLQGEDDLLLKLHETVAIALGETASTAMGMRFDDKLAAESLWFYNMKSVPAIRGTIPPEVSQVRFCADLSRSAPLAKRDLEELSELAARFVPR